MGPAARTDTEDEFPGWICRSWHLRSAGPAQTQWTIRSIQLVCQMSAQPSTSSWEPLTSSIGEAPLVPKAHDHLGPSTRSQQALLHTSGCVYLCMPDRLSCELLAMSTFGSWMHGHGWPSKIMLQIAHIAVKSRWPLWAFLPFSA